MRKIECQEVSSLLALKLEVATSQGPVSNFSKQSSANSHQEHRHLGPLASRNPALLCPQSTT